MHFALSIGDTFDAWYVDNAKKQSLFFRLEQSIVGSVFDISIARDVQFLKGFFKY